MVQQISHEFELIARLKYAPFFLTVEDIVRYARDNGILHQGRGSAANSAVCYALGITEVDPARSNLLFERFISDARDEPPDIDVDFEHERREEVIQYVYRRFGRHRAGLCATVICYRTRGAVREVGKALGLSPDVTAALAGAVSSWSEEVIGAEELRELGLDARDRRLALCIELTRELIGFPRHLSQHPGGFLIARGRLDELVPIENASMEDRTVISWDKDDIEALGMLKVDVLALGMLTCLAKGFELLRRHYGVDLKPATVPAEDSGVYEMLSRADSIGVFQVESRAQQTMLPRLKPRCFLRSRHRGRHRASRPNPGRHGASLSAPPPRFGEGHLPKRGIEKNSRKNARRAALPGTMHADSHCSSRISTCAGRRVAPRNGNFQEGWHHPYLQGRVHPGHARQKLQTRFRGALLQPDPGLRHLRLSRKPRGFLRAARLLLGLAEALLPRRVRRRDFEQPAHGLLCARPAGARCA